MFESRSLESLIRDKVFLGPVSNTGYHQLKCQCCNDYKVRAGFKFDGGAIHYSCFNCGLKPQYTENSGDISKKMREVLNAFGITNEEIDKVVNVAFFNRSEESENITLDSLKKTRGTETPATKLPSKSKRIGKDDSNKELQQDIEKYLTSRFIDPHSYPFYYSENPFYNRRVIIPFYRNKKIIYWQARSIDNDVEPRYLNCEMPKTAVLFNFDQLSSWSDLPLFVCEGVFDALPLNGIATLGSALNDEKIELLSKTKRRLIFIIDRDANGKSVGETAIKHGWDITFAPENHDVNKSIRTYGRLWTIYELMKNIPVDKINAQLALNLNCAKDSRKGKNEWKYKNNSSSLSV